MSFYQEEGYEEEAYIHGVATGRLLAGVALGESPVEGVGEAVLAHVGENTIVLNLERGEIGYKGKCQCMDRREGKGL